MFLDNKYRRWYLLITSSPDLNCYTERHHIVPKSLGGSDDKDNIVLISPRKHFLVHWLLTKFTTGRARRSMLNAMNIMRRRRPGVDPLPKTSWRYEVSRKAMVEYAALREVSPETRAKIGAKHRGKRISAAHAAAVSAANLGRKHTQETRRKVAAAQIGNKKRLGQSPSLATRAKLSVSGKGNKSKTGVTDSDETRRLKSIAHADASKPQKNNKLGLKGVFVLPNGKYRARTKVGGKMIEIGVFGTPEAAHHAYVATVNRVRSTL